MKKMTLEEWIVSNDTGVSSKTIWAGVMGVDMERTGHPHDPSDFGRCVRLVRNCSVSVEDLQLVKRKYSWFAPIIDNWDKLVELWDKESKYESCPELYKYLQELGDQISELQGHKVFRSGGFTITHKKKTN